MLSHLLAWWANPAHARASCNGGALPCDRLACWREMNRMRRERAGRRQGNERRGAWDCGGIRVTTETMVHPWYGLIRLECYDGGSMADVANLITRSKS